MVNLLSLFFTAVLFLLQPIHAQQQFQSGAGHTGNYPNAFVDDSVSVRWKFVADGAVRSTPAVTRDAVIIGSSDGHVYCLTRQGQLRWKFRADGPVSSSPAVDQGLVFFTSRANTLYALRLRDGNIAWQNNLGAPLAYAWGFDYFTSSPAVMDGMLYVGSADGRLFALENRTGKVHWTFRSRSLVRSTPAADAEHVYFGDCSGMVYALKRKTGVAAWQFATIGDTVRNEEHGFDRNAVISSPTLSGGRLFIGSRDGFLYALRTENGALLWKYDYSISWVISTAAVKGDLLITGTSDGRFVHALSVHDGKERWRFMTQATVWASPAISGNDMVVIPSNDGYVYSLELATGRERWRYKAGPQIFSSAVPADNELYFGSDDGSIHALKSGKKSVPVPTGIRRAVFWMKDPVFQTFRGGADVAVRDHFIREGYEYYDETDVVPFLRSRMKSDTASVLVFASNYFLPALTADTLGSNLLQGYMRSGGRVVILGMNPAAYQLDSTGRQIIGIDFEQARKQTGIPYTYKDLRSHGGFLSSRITPEGKTWGLSSPFIAVAGLPVSDVTTVLATDENGNAAAWVRTTGERKHSGFMQLFLSSDRLHQLPEIQRAIEYGLQ